MGCCLCIWKTNWGWSFDNWNSS